MTNMTLWTKTAVIIALLSAFTQPLAGDVYMTRDAQGNVIFSDKPGKNAQVHKVKPLPTVPAYVSPKIPDTAEEEEEQAPAFSYTSLSIVAPGDQHQLPTGFAGKLEISGVLSPGLQPGHQVQLLDNGTVIERGGQTHFNLQYLNRGEHKFQLVVKDEKEKVLIRSNNVTVYVQRHSTLNRSRKNTSE